MSWLVFEITHGAPYIPEGLILHKVTFRGGNLRYDRVMITLTKSMGVSIDLPVHRYIRNVAEILGGSGK